MNRCFIVNQLYLVVEAVVSLVPSHYLYIFMFDKVNFL